MDAPPATASKPAYVLEQLPELTDQLLKGVSWPQVAEAQRAGPLNDTDEDKRAQAAAIRRGARTAPPTISAPMKAGAPTFMTTRERSRSLPVFGSISSATSTPRILTCSSVAWARAWA